MNGVLDVNSPRDMLNKLRFEIQQLIGSANSYATINALRDAYHLREWTWHHRLERDSDLQAAVIGRTPIQENEWNGWVNSEFPRFQIIRELCNGSKHFKPGSAIKQTYQEGWDNAYYDISYYDDNRFYVVDISNNVIDVERMLRDVEAFWNQLFLQYPQLAA
jgi:hypothetical protein